MSLKHAIALRRTMHGTTSFEADIVADNGARGGKVEGATTPQEELALNEGNDNPLDDSPNPFDAIGSFGGEEFHR